MSTTSPLILTLDIGTSSTRAMLFDGQARPLGGYLAQVPNRLLTTVDGGATFDPAALLASVVEVIDQILAQAGPLAKQIGGVAATTFVSNMMGVDVAGRPLTPLYTYADTRSAADADILRQTVDMTEVHNRTGCRIHTSYLPAQLHWLARTQPQLSRSVVHWISLGEYLMGELFRERRVSYSVASWTGLLNRGGLAWDTAWLDFLKLDPARLSPLTDVDQPFQGLRAEWAARWPHLKDTPWFPAIGDGAAANLGSGCTGPERLALTVGSTGAMRVALNHPIASVPAGLWIYRVNREFALLGGATSEGGNVYGWLRQLLQLPDDIEGGLAALEPAAHGLTVLPFVAGERAPGWRGDARAAFNGLTLNTGALDILRAGLEAVALRFALIYRSIAPHLPPEHQIIASGSGLLSSPTWMQIMADVLNRPVIASLEQEATSRGIALLALQALGIADIPDAATGQTYIPDVDHHARYSAALEQQLALYHKLIA